MRCEICDAVLDEVQFDRRYDPIEIEPCRICLDIIQETAYNREDNLDERIVEDAFDAEPDYDTFLDKVLLPVPEIE